MNYKIYTSYHKDELVEKYHLVNDDHHILYPTHKNVDGINLNYLHDRLSDFCAMYYVWKNNLYSDFVGFEHYSRRFDINKIHNLNKDECYVRIYDHSVPTIKEEYTELDILPKNDYYIYENILNNMYGNDNKYVYILENSHEIIWDEIYIMSYDNFIKLCEFLFSIFNKFDNIIKANFNIDNYLKYYDNMSFAVRPHMLERLTSTFILANFKKEKIFAQNHLGLYK